MRVCVALEYRFVRLPDGSVWTRNQYPLRFWQRYLDVFDAVRCLARVEDVPRLDGEWHRADGGTVSFAAVPYYVGPAQYLMRARRVRREIHRAGAPGDAFVLRVPGLVSDHLWRKLIAARHPYGVEVLGDPHDVFSPGAVRHPLRPFFRWYGTRQLRRQCRGACAASYVTDGVLQRRYPAGGPAIGASSIELRAGAVVESPRKWLAHPATTRLIFVGSLEQYYKGPDLLIQAVASSVRRGLDLQLTIVGEGRCRSRLELLAAQEGCADRIRFAGQLPSAQVSPELDAADLFVLPSRTEGLPRAMVEAMARGLPCIGSDAGGIPELLSADAIVPRGSAEALADRIHQVVTDRARMATLSAENLNRAQAYRSEVLQRRRIGFYEQVRDATTRWRDANPVDHQRIAAGAFGEADRGNVLT
jgi:glycosyltransferase involved in cell wall biosynthesis